MTTRRRWRFFAPRRRPSNGLRLAIVMALVVAGGCRFDTAGLVATDPPRCGDGVAELPEPCDGDDLAGVTCADLTGDTDGIPGCQQCSFDPSPCHTCGDGVAEPPESCDGDDLGNDCVTLGHTGGILGCASDCSYDESGCTDVDGDWYDTRWPYRLPITIDHDQVAGDLASFPALIVIDYDGLARAQENGGDLLFTAGDGTTRLAHEIERFDREAGELVAWVNLPILRGSFDTRLYLYYGNPDAAPLATTALVWDGYQGVWHLGEASPTGHYDSTGHANHGAAGGNVQAPGQVGFGQSFDGINDEITIANPTSFALGDGHCTISAWIRTTSAAAMGIVVKSPTDSHVANDKLFGVNHTAGKLGIDQGWVTYLGGVTDVNDGVWHHVAWVQRRDDEGDQERWALWVDGNEESIGHATTAADRDDHSLRLGGLVVGSYFPGRWQGSIDEVRIVHAPQSPTFLQTSHRNQRDPAGFYLVGVEESIWE